jgi:hypothetical protein
MVAVETMGDVFTRVPAGTCRFGTSVLGGMKCSVGWPARTTDDGGGRHG